MMIKGFGIKINLYYQIKLISFFLEFFFVALSNIEIKNLLLL